MQQYGLAAGLTAQLAGPFGSAGAPAKLTQVVLYAAQWKNAESPYFQTVAVPGISENSLLTIQTGAAEIAGLGESGCAVYLENDGGVATAYAVGARPAEDLPLQVILTEVVA